MRRDVAVRALSSNFNGLRKPFALAEIVGYSALASWNAVATVSLSSIDRMLPATGIAEMASGTLSTCVRLPLTVDSI
ncbi:hypothetical protein WT82_29865 [Burkholderia stagnalis]|nr:hypothetical protein WT82_29865 [Burkholderia stagnalis]